MNPQEVVSLFMVGLVGLWNPRIGFASLTFLTSTIFISHIIDTLAK